MEDKITECIYCGSDGLSRTHVFPEVIGGRARPFLACKSCNNLIGEALDKQLEKVVWIAAAKSRLKLQLPSKAFRQATLKIPSVDEAAEWLFDEAGHATAKTKISKDGTGYTTPKNAQRIYGKMLHDKIASHEMKALNSFLESGQAGTFEAGGIIFENRKTFGSEGSVQIHGMTTNISPRFLAKIAFEHLAIWRLHDLPVARDFRDRFLSRAVLESDREPRVLSSRACAIGAVHSVKDYSKCEFQPYFYVYIGLGQGSVLYAIIRFYNFVSYILPIGVSLAEERKLRVLRSVITFYFTDNSKIGVQDAPKSFVGLPLEHMDKLAHGILEGSRYIEQSPGVNE